MTSEPGPYAARKAKWCRGVVGVPHAAELVTPRTPDGAPRCRQTGLFEDSWMCWHYEACSRCSKVLTFPVVCPSKPDHLTQKWTPDD